MMRASSRARAGGVPVRGLRLVESAQALERADRDCGEPRDARFRHPTVCRKAVDGIRPSSLPERNEAEMKAARWRRWAGDRTRGETRAAPRRTSPPCRKRRPRFRCSSTRLVVHFRRRRRRRARPMGEAGSDEPEERLADLELDQARFVDHLLDVTTTVEQRQQDALLTRQAGSRLRRPAPDRQRR